MRKAIPRFNDHGSGCKGHANAVLDCTFEKDEECATLSNILDHYLANYDKMLGNERSTTS